MTSIKRKTGARGVRRGLFGRFGRNGDGSMAIEFAMLAIPFALLIFAVLESCIAFAAQQVLSNATEAVARKVRTGQLRPAAMTQTSLTKMLCDEIDVIVAAGCPGLSVDLKSYATFEEAAKLRTKFTADKDIDTTGFGVSPGPAMSKNTLRVFYRWPVMTDLMRKSMSNLKDNKTLLFSTSTWQNEPFDD